MTERHRAAGLNQPLEGHGIDVHRVRSEGDRLVAGVQAGRIGRGQGAAKDEEGLSQAAAGVML